MAEIVAESVVCDSCGADIRDGSVFCYNCGAAVSETQPCEEAAAGGNDGPFSASELKEAAIDNDIRSAFDAADSESKKVLINGNPVKLRSAASLRQRKKAYSRQPVQFVWEKSASSSPGFVIITIVLTIFTGVLLFLALYLR